MKQEKRSDSKVLDKYLDSSKASTEFVLNQYQEGSENTVLSKELDAALKETEVDNISANVAFNKLQEKIEVNKEVEVDINRNNKVFSSDFSDDQDLFFEKNEGIRKENKLMGLDSDISAQNEQDWKTESIYKEIKKNFKRNKELYSEELEKDQSKSSISTDFFSFLKKDSTEQEIESLFRQYGFNEDKFVQKPEFTDILENIDYLIDNAPISLKSNVQNDSSQFEGNFLNSDIQEQDLLWQNFANNFLKIFPTGNLGEQVQQKDQQSSAQHKELVSNKELETIYTQVVDVDKEDNLRNHIYTEKDLPEDQRVELEVYRRVKTDPFFSHYIQNDLKYFSERMVDGFSDTQRYVQLYDKSGDILNYNEPEERDAAIQLLEEDEPDVKMREKQEIEKELKQKVFAGGKRKKSHCLVILTKGSGKVTVNRKKYLDYFPHPIHRNICLKPVFVANIPCMYDIDVHVRGGGSFGQSEAISVALTRAIVKIYPHLRQQFINLNMIQTDPRKKERKKTGQYKARKGWTYVRR